MKSDPAILELLNEVLTAELTAINQYFVHAKMCANWGYNALAEKKRHESVEEMKHASSVIERVLFLDGVPNMQRLAAVRVGEDPVEQHRLDLALELDAVRRLNTGIAVAAEKHDNGTRELLESILEQEEQSVDWHEASFISSARSAKSTISRSRSASDERCEPGDPDSGAQRPHDSLSTAAQRPHDSLGTAAQRAPTLSAPRLSGRATPEAR